MRTPSYRCKPRLNLSQTFLDEFVYKSSDTELDWIVWLNLDRLVHVDPQWNGGLLIVRIPKPAFYRLQPVIKRPSVSSTIYDLPTVTVANLHFADSTRWSKTCAHSQVANSEQISPTNSSKSAKSASQQCIVCFDLLCSASFSAPWNQA